jgi:hypothetical protein
MERGVVRNVAFVFYLTVTECGAPPGGLSGSEDVGGLQGSGDRRRAVAVRVHRGWGRQGQGEGQQANDVALCLALSTTGAGLSFPAAGAAQGHRQAAPTFSSPSLQEMVSCPARRLGPPLTACPGEPAGGRPTMRDRQKKRKRRRRQRRTPKAPLTGACSGKKWGGAVEYPEVIWCSHRISSPEQKPCQARRRWVRSKQVSTQWTRRPRQNRRPAWAEINEEDSVRATKAVPAILLHAEWRTCVR